MYFEDLDYCARIVATGKLLYYIPSAILVHFGGKSVELSPKRLLLYALENGHAPWLYIKKYDGSVHSGVIYNNYLAWQHFRIFIFTFFL